MPDGNYVVLFYKEKYMTKVNMVIKDNNQPKFLAELIRQDNGPDYEISFLNIIPAENSVFIPYGDNDVVDTINAFMDKDDFVLLVDDYERKNEENNYIELKRIDGGIIINFSTPSIKIKKMGPNKLVNSLNNNITRLETVFNTLENKYSPKKR